MKLLVLPADGIGPEITDAAMTVLRAADRRYGLDLSFDFDDAGFPSLKKHGTTLRQELLERAKAYDGTILGTQSHADYPPARAGRPQHQRRLSHRPRPLRERAAGAHAPVP